MKLMIYLIIIGVVSVISFFLYLSDKRKAIKHQWRVPEKVLLGSGLIGGALGSLCAMYLFRHKTQHWYFNVLNILFLLLHVALGILLYMLENDLI